MTKNENVLQGGAQSRHRTLTKEAAMASIPKIIGVISCSVVLGLSLSTAAQAGMSPGPCNDRKTGQPNLFNCNENTVRGIDTITGEVLRVEGSNYLIQQFNGKEMWLHVDPITKMIGHIDRGNRVEARVGEVSLQKKYTLSLRQLE